MRFGKLNKFLSGVEVTMGMDVFHTFGIAQLSRAILEA